MTETVKLIAFPGAPNLPIFVAKEKDWFTKHGVALDMTLTPNSAYQAEALAKGEFDIAGTAFDNVVAYTEGQGAVKFDTPPDFFAFLGATQIELAIVARPEFKTIADLAGQNLALDAPGTGFAFVFYDMLEKGGVKPGQYERAAVGATPTRWESVRDGKHAATMTIEPFTSIAKAQGFNILARSTQTLADYQGGVFASRRSWAAKNGSALKGFIKAYLDGQPRGRGANPAAQHARHQAGRGRFGDGEPAVAGVRPDAEGRRDHSRHPRGARSAVALWQARPRAERSA